MYSGGGQRVQPPPPPSRSKGSKKYVLKKGEKEKGVKRGGKYLSKFMNFCG